MLALAMAATGVAGTLADSEPYTSCVKGDPAKAFVSDVSDAPPGMVWIPTGEFPMGSADSGARPDERPVHRVCVDGFWMDHTEVTNAQFRLFIDAVGYVTTAERKPDWEELKKQFPPGTPNSLVKK